MEKRDENLKMVVFLKKSTKRNPGCVIIAMVGRYDWGTWGRVFKHRGILDIPICSRPMTEEEKEVYRNAWRMRYCEYRSWEKLIIDEIKITKDIKWCKELMKHAKIVWSEKIMQAIYINSL